jgi:2-polyprenyl-6-methoxyphenol hydroxylase-like FAD-dependent oxidoreductase
MAGTRRHGSSEFRVDAQVIIVGAGPVGLSLALGLARYGTRSVVLERRTESSDFSRAINVWPRTLEIYRDWGVYAPLREAGTFVVRFRARNAHTEKDLVCVDFSYLDDVVHDPGVLILPQSTTERILRELVEANPLCELRTGVEVTGLEQTASHVDVQCRSGDMETTLRASYVVGCDGAHGSVRKALGLSLEGITYDSRVVLSDEILDTEPSGDALVRVYLEEPGLKVAIRFAPQTWRVIATVPKNVPDEEGLSESAHAARLQELFGNCGRSSTTWRSLFNIHRRHVQHFVIGRVALAGDAAHLNSPAGGQGMNAGIQDAANLAWKLAAALGGRGDGTTLFESYDAERREMITDTIERVTDRLTRIAIGFPPSAKQLALRLFSRALRGRGMQRKAGRGLGMLSGRYTKSPVIDSRHPLAGRRIDDLLLRDGTRINQKRHGDAMLVRVGGDDDFGYLMACIATPPKRWHVKPPVVLIVRPDGCVAAVVEKPTRKRIETAWNVAFCGTLPLPQPSAA